MGSHDEHIHLFPSAVGFAPRALMRGPDDSAWRRANNNVGVYLDVCPDRIEQELVPQTIEIRLIVWQNRSVVRDGQERHGNTLAHRRWLLRLRLRQQSGEQVERRFGQWRAIEWHENMAQREGMRCRIGL